MATGGAFSTEELSACEWAQFCVATTTNPTLCAGKTGVASKPSGLNCRMCLRKFFATAQCAEWSAGSLK